MKLLKFFTGFLVLFFCTPQTQAQTATIYWNNVDQVIDGFGASDAFELGPLNSTQAALFFSPTTGIGLSLLRTKVPDDGSCLTVNTTCAGEVADMQLAIANGAKVWSTPWSPPASMKSNGSVNNGGSLLPDSYAAYASYLANYVKSLQGSGITLYGLSVQNEPNLAASYDSAIWSAADFDAFIRNNLGPTFAADGLTPLIVMPEPSDAHDLAEFANTTMDDPTAAHYVSINAVHDYDRNGASPYPPGQGEGKHLWQTEVSDSDAFDPSMTSALKYAQGIHNWMTIANANAWHFWWLVGKNNDDDNEGLIGPAGTLTKRLYMLGNYSKFVRPGFYRIDATAKPQSGVLVSAYKNSTSGPLVIVVINQNGSSVSQTFALNGTTMSTVTPWITSATSDLVKQPDVSVNGGSFTYSLPGYSITSFVGTTTLNSVSAAPLPPTRLTAVVK